MSERIKILSGEEITHPKTLLPSRLETGIVTFALGTEFVNIFKEFGRTVNGKSVIIWNSNGLGATVTFRVDIPFRVINGTRGDFGAFEGAGKFLSCVILAERFTVTVHGKTSLAEWNADRQERNIFGVTRIDRNESVTVIGIANSIVDFLDVIADVGDEITLVKREKSICVLENIDSNGAIGCFCAGSYLKNGQPCDTVNQYMVFVTPVELVISVCMLI